MQVSDQELRELVRDAIARHTGQRSAEAFALPGQAFALRGSQANSLSFGKFLALTPGEDGQCVIEPAVRCNHCGYCQSYGH